MTAEFQLDNKRRLKQVRNLEELIQFKVKEVKIEDFYRLKNFKNTTPKIPEPPTLEPTVSGAGNPPTLQQVRDDPVKYLKLYFDTANSKPSQVVRNQNLIMRRYQKEKQSRRALTKIETVKNSLNNFKETIESLKKIDVKISQVQLNNLKNPELMDSSISQENDYAPHDPTLTKVSQLRKKLSKVFTEASDTDDGQKQMDVMKRYNSIHYAANLIDLPKVSDQRNWQQPPQKKTNNFGNRVSSIGHLAGIKSQDHVQSCQISKMYTDLEYKQRDSVIRMEQMKQSREKHKLENPYACPPVVKPNLDKKQDIQSKQSSSESTVYLEPNYISYPHINKKFQEDNFLHKIKVKNQPKPAPQFILNNQVKPESMIEANKKPELMIEANKNSIHVVVEQKSRQDIQYPETAPIQKLDQEIIQAQQENEQSQDNYKPDINEYVNEYSKELKFEDEQKSQSQIQNGPRKSVKLASPSEDDQIYEDAIKIISRQEEILNDTSTIELNSQLDSKMQSNFITGTTTQKQNSSPIDKNKNIRIHQKEFQNFEIDIKSRKYESAAETQDHEKLRFLSDIIKSYGQYVTKPGFEAKRFKKLPSFKISLGKNQNETFEKNYISLNNQIINYLANELGTQPDLVPTSIIKELKISKSKVRRDKSDYEIQTPENKDLVMLPKVYRDQSVQEIRTPEKEEPLIVSDQAVTEDPFDKVLLVKNIDNAILTSFRTLKGQNNLFTDSMKVIHQNFLPLEGKKLQQSKIKKLYRQAYSLMHPVSDQEESFDEDQLCVEIPSQQACGMEIKPVKIQKKATLSLEDPFQEKIVVSLAQANNELLKEIQQPKIKIQQRSFNLEQIIQTISDEKQPNLWHSDDESQESNKPKTKNMISMFSIVDNDQADQVQAQTQDLHIHQNLAINIETEQSPVHLESYQYQFNDYIQENKKNQSQLRFDQPSPLIGVGGFKIRKPKKQNKIISSVADNTIVIPQQTVSASTLENYLPTVEQSNNQTHQIIQNQTELLKSKAFVNQLGTSEAIKSQYLADINDIMKDSLLSSNGLNLNISARDQLRMTKNEIAEMISARLSSKEHELLKEQCENEKIAKQILGKQSETTSYKLQRMINNLYQDEINFVYKRIEREANIDKYNQIFNLSKLPPVDPSLRGNDLKNKKETPGHILVGGTKVGLQAQKKVQKKK